MGDVGNFLFGGSKERNSSSQSSQSSSTSQNQSTSNQGSANVSQQQSAAGSLSSNRAYDPLAASLTPSLGYVTSAGNMLGALLGLPQSTFNYATTPVPSSAPMPSSRAVNMGQLVDTLGRLTRNIPAPVTPPASGTPPVGTQPPAPSPGMPPAGTPPIAGSPPATNVNRLMDSIVLQRREQGGPVNAGTPYIVGEKRPEVFVPHTNGTILPSITGAMKTQSGVPQVNPGFRRALPTSPTPVPPVTAQPPSAYSGSNPYNPSPGSPSDAVNTFADSAGMNFILDQGQKAISGASASNGVFNSGATGKALVQYGQNLGKTYLGDYMNRLLDYAKLGLGSASALTGAGGTNISQSTQTGGSVGTSYGSSQSTGNSASQSTGYGTSSGSGNSKKGLVPAILG